MSALSGCWGGLERTLLTLTVSGLISSRQVQRSFLKSSWTLSLCLVWHLSWLLPAQRSDYAAQVVICILVSLLWVGFLLFAGGWGPRLLKALGLPGQKQRLPGTTDIPQPGLLFTKVRALGDRDLGYSRARGSQAREGQKWPIIGRGFPSLRK